MKNTSTPLFIVIAIIVVFLGGMIWLGRPSDAGNNTTPPPATTSSGALKSNESLFNFGNISMAKGMVNHVFQVKNEGTEPVIITKMYTSCMCTTAALRNQGRMIGPFGMQGHGGAIPSISETVAPGQTVDVDVIFDPAAHGPAGVGKIDRAVYLENNAGKPLMLNFSVFVTP